MIENDGEFLEAYQTLQELSTSYNDAETLSDDNRNSSAEKLIQDYRKKIFLEAYQTLKKEMVTYVESKSVNEPANK